MAASCTDIAVFQSLRIQQTRLDDQMIGQTLNIRQPSCPLDRNIALFPAMEFQNFDDGRFTQTHEYREMGSTDFHSRSLHPLSGKSLKLQSARSPT